jgi:4-hydroxy-3-methylbut-2-en-1-yl diphosphate reductase
MIECPAAAVLAARLRSKGASVNALAQPEPGVGGNGILMALSWVDRRGACAGIGVVAHQDDTSGMALAEQTMAEWARLLRSRRLLIADAPPQCWGGRRTLDLIWRKLRATRSRRVFVIGIPLASAAELDGLRRSGVVFVAGLDEVPDGATVMYPAHGAALPVRAEAAARGLTVLDTTCPRLSPVLTDAARYGARGDAVAVIGRAGDAALPTVLSHAGPTAVVVEDTAGVCDIPSPASGGISFVIEPGVSADAAMPAVKALRSRFPSLRGHHFDALCEAAADRAGTIAAVAAASEVMLVLTGTRHDDDLQTVARSCGAHPDVRPVTAPTDIDVDALAPATTIGIAATRSAPASLPTEVQRALSGMGPISVRHRQQSTDPLPDLTLQAPVHEPGHGRQIRGPLV